METLVAVEIWCEVSPLGEIWVEISMEGIIWSAREWWSGHVGLIDAVEAFPASGYGVSVKPLNESNVLIPVTDYRVRNYSEYQK